MCMCARGTKRRERPLLSNDQVEMMTHDGLEKECLGLQAFGLLFWGPFAALLLPLTAPVSLGVRLSCAIIEPTRRYNTPNLP